jgi:hypothetical protein
VIDLKTIDWSKVDGHQIPEIICIETLQEYGERLQEWADERPRGFFTRLQKVRVRKTRARKEVDWWEEPLAAKVQVCPKNFRPAHMQVCEKDSRLDRFKPTGETRKAEKISAGSPSVPEAQHPFVPYLNKLFEPGDRICIMAIHSTEEWAPGQAKTNSYFQSLEMTVAEDSLPMLDGLQKQGWHLYVCMSPLVEGSTRRTKDRVAAVRSVYCEADENGLAVREEMRKAVAAEEIPVPHYVIESSPGKFQFIWLVEEFATTAQQEQMNSSLQVRFKTDPASVDCVRVLRLPGFKNLKPVYGPDFPTSRIVFENKKNTPRYRPEDFKIQIVDPVRAADYREPIADEEINKIVNYLADALNEAGVEFGDVTNLPSGAVQIHLIECPWGYEHSEGKRGNADVFVNSDGSLGFWCFHTHCAGRDWDVFREELENRAGHKLKFGGSAGLAVCESVTFDEYRQMMWEQYGIIYSQPKTETTAEPTAAKEIEPEPAKVVPPVTEQPAAPVIVEPPTEKAETSAEPPKEPKYTGDKRQLEAEYCASLSKQNLTALAEQSPTEQTEPAEQEEITFREKKPAVTVTVIDSDGAFNPNIEEKVPPYDESLVRGFFETAVKLVAGGTSMPIQFPHIIAKTICGLRWSVEESYFQDCDAEARLYTLNIGAKGTSKGWSMKRCRQLFTNFGSELPAHQESQKIKIWDGTDSGAGLKEAFFDYPADAGILLYIDETYELGAKARADRNPEIISTMLTLAESTNIGRGKAKKDERKVKTDARLASLLCVQPDIIPIVFAGMKAGALGFFDRLTLEFAEPRKKGRTPKMEDKKDEVKDFYTKFLGLSKLHINQGEKARRCIEEYWESLSEEEQTGVRRSKSIYLDHFLIQASLMAGCERPKTVGTTTVRDALDAIANDERQTIIRRIYLNTEITDKIGFYSFKLKRIAGKQWEALRAGAAPENVALTVAQLCDLTNARRDNEEHLFMRSWQVCGPMYFKQCTEKVQVKGRKTEYFIVRPENL